MRYKSLISSQIKFLMAVILSGQVALAQHVHVMSTSGATQGSLPVIVDASKNPGLIPDALAYQHFFTAVAAHPSPTTQEQARQSAQLGPLQLSPADLTAMITILASFRVQLDQLVTAVSVATTPAAIAALQAQKAALAATTLVSLKQALTPAGAIQVNQYIQTRVKTHIKIYGGPM